MFRLITNDELARFFNRGDTTGTGLGKLGGLVDTRRAYAQGQRDPNTFPDGFDGLPYSETVILNKRGNGESTPVPPPAMVIPAIVSALPRAQVEALKDTGTPAQSVYNPYPFTIGRASYQVLQQNNKRIALIVFNLSAGTNLYANFGLNAAPGNGLLMVPQTGILWDAACPVNSIYVFMDNAVAQNGIVLEGNPL